MNALVVEVLAAARANLNARIQARIDFDIHQQFEITIGSVTAQERVRAVLGRAPDNGAVFDTVGGQPVALRPALQRLAVEQRDKARVVGR